jgi:hypothetical protein
MKQLQTLAEICEKYSIFGTTKIHVCFKAHKVTASCRIRGINCGASGETFNETMSNLEVQIAAQTRTSASITNTSPTEQSSESLNSSINW